MSEEWDEPEVDWESLPRVDGQLWGPDLFAWAYDLLAETGAWRGSPAPEQIVHDSAVKAWREEVRRASGWVDDWVLDEMREAKTANPSSPVLLKIVVAVDRAYLGIRLNRPMAVSTASHLEVANRLWGSRGSLHQAALGLVLRKGSQWRVGTALSHYCDNLARVPADLSARTTIRPMTAPWSLGELVRQQDGVATVKVAFVPTLTDADATEFVPVDRDGDQLFQLALSPTGQASLAEWMDGLVRDLEEEHVNLALFPETVLTEDTCEVLEQALIDNFERRKQERRRPSLRMVVVGVGAEGKNYARAFGADGALLGTQKKIQPWRLSAAEQDRYDLGDTLDGVERCEDLETNAAVTLIDDPGFGRLMLLICEDLARGDTRWLLSTAVTPTMVASPVMDDSLADDRWAYLAALDLAQEPGSLVLVANSFVLPLRRAGAHRDDGPDSCEAGVGLICHPSDYDQTAILKTDTSVSFLVREIHWDQAKG